MKETRENLDRYRNGAPHHLLERKAAKGRQAQAGVPRDESMNRSGKSPTRSRDKVGVAIGMSGVRHTPLVPIIRGSDLPGWPADPL